MEDHNQNITSGIYALLCLCRGFAYIGKSFELPKRLRHQFWLLRTNRHKCKDLQADWNRYGPDCFTTTLLEPVPDRKRLCPRERAWTRKCAIEGRVYNQQNAVREQHRKAFEKRKPNWPSQPVGKSAKKYNFVSPTGKEMNVQGLRGISEAYGLNESHMSKVARGIYVQHRGWRSGDFPDDT